MPVLHSHAGSRVLLSPASPGARSDAAKLQHSVVGFAVEACSEFRQLIPSYAALGVLGRGMLRRKAVPKHVCIFLKTDFIWRTHYAHLARQCCVPRTPCGTWFPEKDFPEKDSPEKDSRRGRAPYRRCRHCSRSTRRRSRRRSLAQTS